MFIGTYTENFPNKKSISMDKLFFQNIDLSKRLSTTNNSRHTNNNYITNLALMTFNNIMPKPRNSNDIFINKIKYNKLYNQFHLLNYFNTTKIQSKTQNNFYKYKNLSSQKILKKTQSFIKSIKYRFNSEPFLQKYRNNKKKHNHNYFNTFLDNNYIFDRKTNIKPINIKHNYNINRPIINYDNKNLKKSLDNMSFKNRIKNMNNLLFNRKNKSIVNNHKYKKIPKNNKFLFELKKENKEFKKFIYTLQKNIDKNNSKSKPKKNFDY